MSKEITIVAVPRAERGKNEARRLRASGRLPAVIYGAGQDATAVSVSPKEINAILFSAAGHNTIFKADVSGQGLTSVMVVAWQHDPVTDKLLHVDLERIDLTKKMVARVPVQLDGEPKGIKLQGGLLDVVNRELRVECLPGNIPDQLRADISEMMIGDNLRARDVELPEGVTLVSKPERVICHVVEMRAAETTEVAEEEGEGEVVAEEGEEKEKE